MIQKLQGQKEGVDGKCVCERCGKRLTSINFYTYKDGSKCEICKPCLTAHIDNFDPQTFEWILQKMDVPYIETQWNTLRDRAFAKNPYKMNGMSVVGKYLAKMKLKQWNKYGYADTESIREEMRANTEAKQALMKEQQEKYQAELKEQLEKGEISLSQYQTLVSTETQNNQLPPLKGNVITGEIAPPKGAKSYEEALSQMRNPFQEEGFIPESELVDVGADLTQDDKIYLALKWGRLYRPSQWVSLQQLYNEFMDSFDIQGAARIDTLKMICKTSLKMNEAIDMGDVDSYQKLSRVYDSMMKSAKFTEAQNKDTEGQSIDSVSALVDFVEANEGAVPKFECHEPQDLIDKIILDLKAYNKSLIYEDKSLAQEIEKYLQDKRIADQMRKDKKEAKEKGLDHVELQDNDFVDHKESLRKMREHDQALDDEKAQQEYLDRRLKRS